jgi:hypothetical protein
MVAQAGRLPHPLFVRWVLLQLWLRLRRAGIKSISKSEYRNPKQFGIFKFSKSRGNHREGNEPIDVRSLPRLPTSAATGAEFGFSLFPIRICFGFRISKFEFIPL